MHGERSLAQRFVISCKLAFTSRKNKYTLGNKLDGSADSLWFGFSIANVDLLWVRRTKRHLRFAICCFVRDGVYLRISAGRLAVRFSRINLGTRRATTMAVPLEIKHGAREVKRSQFVNG
jgi:hypothetical protein